MYLPSSYDHAYTTYVLLYVSESAGSRFLFVEMLKVS